MKYAKRIGALICVIAICFTLGTAPSAHASGLLGGQAAGAWIAAGLVALNIVADVAIGSIGNYFGWQGHPTSTALLEQDIRYTFPVATEFISDYLNASTIQVRQGVTTIDGVEYDEVFVEPGTFTNGLKTNLFDFKTKWNIISGQSGITLAEGAGYVQGYPENQIYKVGNTYTLPSITVPGEDGEYQLYVGNYIKGANNQLRFYTGATYICNYSAAPVKVSYIWPNYPNKTMEIHFKYTGGEKTKGLDIPVVNEPFEYEYTSGVVPAEKTDIPDNMGMSIQIPHSQLETFYNTYPQYNVDQSTINITEDNIDIEQLTQAIFDQIQSMEDINVEWKSEEEPEPPEPPEPAEDILEGINTLIGQQSQQINQNQAQQAIQQQQLQQQQQISQDTSSIKDAIDSVTQTPSSEDLPDFKFDLRELFPFCIPFDIYRLLSSFDAEPVAPHVQLPIVIQSIGFSYNLDLDFSAWNPVAQAMRTAELIVYAIGLAWATGKVIKW